MFMAAQVSGLNSALIYTARNPIVRMVIAQEQILPGLCNATFGVTYRTQKILQKCLSFETCSQRSLQSSHEF